VLLTFAKTQGAWVDDHVVPTAEAHAALVPTLISKYYATAWFGIATTEALFPRLVPVRVAGLEASAKQAVDASTVYGVLGRREVRDRLIRNTCKLTQQQHFFQRERQRLLLTRICPRRRHLGLSRSSNSHGSTSWAMTSGEYFFSFRTLLLIVTNQSKNGKYIYI
jgi:hypothetical protein